MERTRITEANQVPEGDKISAHIFGLPCVGTAYKTARGGIVYLVEGVMAKAGDWIVRYGDGTWGVVDDNRMKNYVLT